MTTLLDANVLIALTVTDHVHHGVVEAWFAGHDDEFATCPITEGSLLRHLLRTGTRLADARDVLLGLIAAQEHEFWSDSVPLAQVSLRGVVGHRQVTDAYLAGLARARGGWLATLDRGMAALHPDVVVLLDP